MIMLPVMKRNSWLPEVFDDFLNSNLMPRANATAPAINVLENDKQYTVELAAPGLKKDRPERKDALPAPRVQLLEVRADIALARRRKPRGYRRSCKRWCANGRSAQGAEGGTKAVPFDTSRLSLHHSTKRFRLANG